MLFTISYPFGELLSESSVTMWWWWGEAGSNCDNGVVMRTGAPRDAGRAINLTQPWSNPVSIRQCAHCIRCVYVYVYTNVYEYTCCDAVWFTVSLVRGHVCQLLLHCRLIIPPSRSNPVTVSSKTQFCGRDHTDFCAIMFCHQLINSVQNVQFCAIY